MFRFQFRYICRKGRVSVKRRKGFCSLYSGKMRTPSSRDPVYACFSTARGILLNYRTLFDMGLVNFNHICETFRRTGWSTGCKRQDRTANMNLTYAYIIGLALPRPETVPTWMCDLGDILESSLGQSISVRTGSPSLF